MIEDDLCLSPILGRSDPERREIGLEEECLGSACSDSEELEAIDEELDMVGDMLGRTAEE
jgi:hypothetical protein